MCLPRGGFTLLVARLEKEKHVSGSLRRKKNKKVSSPSCSVTLHISVFVKCHLRVCDPVKAADQFTLEANPGKLQLNGS